MNSWSDISHAMEVWGGCEGEEVKAYECSRGKVGDEDCWCW